MSSLQGIHYCGELGEGTLTRVLIDQLTDGQLVWEKVDEIYDVVAIGEAGKKKYYEMKCGPRQVFRDNLVRQFPDDVKAIDKFMALLKVWCFHSDISLLARHEHVRVKA